MNAAQILFISVKNKLWIYTFMQFLKFRFKWRDQAEKAWSPLREYEKKLSVCGFYIYDYNRLLCSNYDN